MQHRVDVGAREHGLDRLRRGKRMALRDLGFRDEPAIEHQLLKAREPDLVVALAQIVVVRTVLAREP
jgi:hypothetical protein